MYSTKQLLPEGKYESNIEAQIKEIADVIIRDKEAVKRNLSNHQDRLIELIDAVEVIVEHVHYLEKLIGVKEHLENKLEAKLRHLCNRKEDDTQNDLTPYIPRTSAQQQEDVNKVYSSLQAADIAKQEPKGVVLTEEEHTEAYFIQLANNAALR
jgi:hypothetical protein